LNFIDLVFKKIRGKVLPRGKLCYDVVDGRIRLQKQKLSEIFSGQETLNPIIALRWLRLPHNLSFNLTIIHPKNLLEVIL